MVHHWTANLNNIPNESLKATWQQIASVFADHIENHDDPQSAKEWTVLSPPTGAGKSESIVTYGAMLSDRDTVDHPGMLVVTRLTDDCDTMADRINQFGSKPTAISYHSKVGTRANLNDLKDWPVVIITHRAFQMALDFLGHEGRIEQTWPYFIEYQRNGHLPSGQTTQYPNQNPFVSQRRLIVIDECLDIVEHHAVSLENLRQTLATIPGDHRKKFSSDIAAIEMMIHIFEQIDKFKDPSSAKERMLFEESAVTRLSRMAAAEGHTIRPPDFSKLVAALKEIRFDKQQNRDDAFECERLRKMHEDRLRSLHHVFRSWSYYAKHKVDHTIHTSRLLVPEGIKGCVVMDATASTNLVHELYDDCRVIEPPTGSRNYSNVTVHVSRGHRVGKVHMSKNARDLSGQLISDLNTRLSSQDVLIVCHKAVEPVLNKFDTTFKRSTGHWGKIDGSNQWKNCDTVVIFGLPIMPETWTANVYMALQGPQSTAWLQGENGRKYGKHHDVRQALKWGEISTRVIQAINRVRCRNTIDHKGNCKPTDVYLMIPNGEQGANLLLDIQTMMPSIQIKDDWNYKHKKKKAKASKHEQAVIKFLENAESGSRHTPVKMIKTLGMSMRTMRNIITKTKDPESDISKEMQNSGVSYEVVGSGRSQKAYFEKK
jgi:hypothetical protein